MLSYQKRSIYELSCLHLGSAHVLRGETAITSLPPPPRSTIPCAEDSHPQQRHTVLALPLSSGFAVRYAQLLVFPMWHQARMVANGSFSKLVRLCGRLRPLVAGCVRELVAVGRSEVVKDGWPA